MQSFRAARLAREADAAELRAQMPGFQIMMTSCTMNSSVSTVPPTCACAPPRHRRRPHLLTWAHQGVKHTVHRDPYDDGSNQPALPHPVDLVAHAGDAESEQARDDQELP